MRSSLFVRSMGLVGDGGAGCGGSLTLISSIVGPRAPAFVRQWETSGDGRALLFFELRSRWSAAKAHTDRKAKRPTGCVSGWGADLRERRALGAKLQRTLPHHS